MIIGISGKKGSGKDLSGMILQALTNKLTTFDGMEVITEEDVAYKIWDSPTFKNVKFADTLKNFICVLLGCTREKLEEREYKESVLPEVWWYWRLERESGYSTVLKPYKEATGTKNYELIKTTPRLLLQLMGTECGRQILHPNIWVNAVMANYLHTRQIYVDGVAVRSKGLPHWVITDMRFPNELEVVQKNGITIRVERFPEFIMSSKGPGETKKVPFDLTNPIHVDLWRGESMRAHESERALDDAEFDYTIVNDGSIKDLVESIKEILIKEKII
tara:strand:+ start:14853 stop:15677 length:825 start_codon:yes stop_codon:yes gene_type:complete